MIEFLANLIVAVIAKVTAPFKLRPPPPPAPRDKIEKELDDARKRTTGAL